MEGDACGRRGPAVVLSVIGTRPEAIKMLPVVEALAAWPGIAQHLLFTGQHRGLEAGFEGYARHRLHCDLKDLSVAGMRERLRASILERLEALHPDLVIVQGDTTSALAGALAASDLGIKVAHVEAGLRSFDPAQPYPEEENRVAIDAIASILFAPTAGNAANLAAEPAVRGEVHVTGNSGVDALLAAAPRPAMPREQGPRRRIVVTCHRYENQKQVFHGIAQGLRRLVSELPVELLFPLPVNEPKRRPIVAELGGVEHIALLPPLDHADMVALLRSSWAILTDSGGLQEDGPPLGIPVLLMRELTERPEAIGNVELVGADPGRILHCVNRLLMSQTHYALMAEPSFPFGDGRAAPRIAELIADFLERRMGTDRTPSDAADALAD